MRFDWRGKYSLFWVNRKMGYIFDIVTHLNNRDFVVLKR